MQSAVFQNPSVHSMGQEELLEFCEHVRGQGGAPQGGGGMVVSSLLGFPWRHRVGMQGSARAEMQAHRPACPPCAAMGSEAATASTACRQAHAVALLHPRRRPSAPSSPLSPPTPPGRVQVGYHARLEPQGTLALPPETNVPVTDWERSIKLRKGEFQVRAEPGGGGGRRADWDGGRGRS